MYIPNCGIHPNSILKKYILPLSNYYKTTLTALIKASISVSSLASFKKRQTCTTMILFSKYLLDVKIRRPICALINKYIESEPQRKRAAKLTPLGFLALLFCLFCLFLFACVWYKHWNIWLKILLSIHKRLAKPVQCQAEEKESKWHPVCLCNIFSKVCFPQLGFKIAS